LLRVETQKKWSRPGTRRQRLYANTRMQRGMRRDLSERRFDPSDSVRRAALYAAGNVNPRHTRAFARRDHRLACRSRKSGRRFRRAMKCSGIITARSELSSSAQLAVWRVDWNWSGYAARRRSTPNSTSAEPISASGAGSGALVSEMFTLSTNAV
jgi:hypothetical protein